MVNISVSSPGQRKVKKSQELSKRRLIHDIHHTHLCNQEVQDAAPGGHWNHTGKHKSTNSNKTSNIVHEDILNRFLKECSVNCSLYF